MRLQSTLRCIPGVLLLALYLMASQAAKPQNFTSLYSFIGPKNGVHPTSLKAVNGGFYGVTDYGGDYNLGTVFKLTSDGKLTTQHAFSGKDGAIPFGVLASGNDGALYGTTYLGGVNGVGTIFKISLSGDFTTLYSFGAIFGINRPFINLDGAAPKAALVQGGDGALYGATTEGGLNGSGTIFKISPSGDFMTLYTFSVQSHIPPFGNPDGVYPDAALVQGGDGALYGTTAGGGLNGSGTIFKISQGDAFSIIYTFSATDASGDNSDGMGPNDLVQGSDGDLYGTTSQGGDFGLGSLFRYDLPFALVSLTISPTSVLGGNRTLLTLTLSKPAPAGGVTVSLASDNPAVIVPPTLTVPAGKSFAHFVLAPAGVSADVPVHITATLGQYSITGVFTLLRPRLVQVSLTPSPIQGGQSATGTVALDQIAPAGGAVVNISSSDRSAVVPATVTIPEGARSVNFTMTTIPVTSTRHPLITAVWSSDQVYDRLTITP